MKMRSPIDLQKVAIAGLVSSQLCLLSLPVKAQTATPSINANCGIFRPFTKATTTWSGGNFTTWATAEGILFRWNGFYYAEVARQYSARTGSSGTAAADAGLTGATGWFEGDSIHDFAYWSGPRSLITGEFRC